MLKRLCNYKSYKLMLLKRSGKKTYYMDDDYAEKAQNANEINKIYEWDETTLNNQQEYAFQAEVNEVFQK